MTPDEKRLLPPPEIIGEVGKLWRQDGGRRLTWYVDIRMPDGTQKRLHADSRGVLRRRLLYFKTMDRNQINSLIPPGPAQPPKSEKTLAKIRKRTEAKNKKRGKSAEPTMKRIDWKEVTDATAPPQLTLMDLMRRRREAARRKK